MWYKSFVSAFDYFLCAASCSTSVFCIYLIRAARYCSCSVTLSTALKQYSVVKNLRIGPLQFQTVPATVRTFSVLDYAQHLALCIEVLQWMLLKFVCYCHRSLYHAKQHLFLLHCSRKIFCCSHVFLILFAFHINVFNGSVHNHA